VSGPATHSSASTNPRPAVGRLHVLTDTTLQSRYSHLQVARLAFAAGADVVQFREKCPTPAHLAELQRMQDLPRASHQRLVVNDHLRWAAELGADGVHLGQDDATLAEAERLLPPDRIIGLTVHTEAELAVANTLNLSYIGVGPVFGTTSKRTGLPPLGLERLAAFCAASRHPVIAIGRITAARVPEVLASGSHGIAVLSAVVCAADVGAAVAELAAAVRAG